MSNVINFILTNSAAELIQKVLNGKTLNFTRMAVGDGFSYNLDVAKGYKTLVNEVLSIDITKSEIQSVSSIKITAVFKNTDAQKEFYYREVGLYAQDPDTGEEVLYAYGNRNDAAELITPAGSNIVTKQLIFIVTVGDSANVTFNVNADIYALQSDMLEVQAEIEQIQTGLGQAQTEIQQAQIDIETLQADKANKNLSNTGMITNCLLEVPQTVKYEFANNTLTIKAGTILIVPYGTEAPTLNIGDYLINTNYKIVDVQYENEKCFYRVELLSDMSYNEPYYIASTPCYVCIQLMSNAIGIYALIDTYFTYTNNFVEHSSFAGTIHCLPIMLATRDATGIGSVDQVFNGMGYMGSTVWVDKGVKCLMPDGRNKNGTLNNIIHTLNTIQSYTITEEFVDAETPIVLTSTHLGYFRSYKTLYFGEKPTNPAHHTRWYDSVNNVWWEYSNEKGWVIGYYCIIGTMDISNTRINSFTHKNTFKAVDKTNDKNWLSRLCFPSDKYISYNLGENGSKYIAPANGWFAVRKVVGIANGALSLIVRNSADTDEMFRVTAQKTYETDEISIIAPISKGQLLVVGYNITGETIYFKFIYAQGEVN